MDFRAVYPYDDIVSLKANFLGGAPVAYVSHAQTAFSSSDAFLFSNLRVKFCDCASKHGTLHRAILTQIGHDFLYDCGRDSE